MVITKTKIFNLFHSKFFREIKENTWVLEFLIPNYTKTQITISIYVFLFLFRSRTQSFWTLFFWHSDLRPRRLRIYLLQGRYNWCYLGTHRIKTNFEQKTQHRKVLNVLAFGLGRQQDVFLRSTNKSLVKDRVGVVMLIGMMK